MESVEIITQHGKAEMLARIVSQSYSNSVPRSWRNAWPPENECTCSRDATSDGSEEFHARAAGCLCGVWEPRKSNVTISNAIAAVARHSFLL